MESPTTIDPAQNEAIQKLIDLDEEINAVEDELKKLKANRQKVEALVRDMILSLGFKKVVLPSGVSVAPSRQIYASKVAGCDPEYLVDRMKEAGLDDLITTSVNTSRVSAWIREREQETGSVLHDNCDAVLPKPLQGLITIWEKLGVSIRKGR
jgi:hypothetical protein